MQIIANFKLLSLFFITLELFAYIGNEHENICILLFYYINQNLKKLERDASLGQKN